MATHTAELTTIFQALGDESRYRIVQLLREERDLCVSEVADEIGITTAAISQHMKVLESAGLVQPQRRGQKICYRLDKHSRTNQALLNLIK